MIFKKIQKVIILFFLKNVFIESFEYCGILFFKDRLVDLLIPFLKNLFF